MSIKTWINALEIGQGLDQQPSCNQDNDGEGHLHSNQQAAKSDMAMPRLVSTGKTAISRFKG